VTAATGHHPRDDLPGLLLGELPPATAVAVDRHLAACDACRRDLAAVAVASSALRDASRLRFSETAEVPPLPSSFLRDRRRRSRWLLGAAAVVLALALGAGGLTLGRDRDRDPGRGRGQTVALGAPDAGPATAEARMRGDGDDQLMAMSARDLPRPPAGAYYEVWLVDGAGDEFPVGVLAPNGEGIWSLPADVAARYRTIAVTLEPADGNPSRSDRTVLRGSYA
jgi:anti-sigma-K factor RskA